MTKSSSFSYQKLIIINAISILFKDVDSYNGFFIVIFNTAVYPVYMRNSTCFSGTQKFLPLLWSHFMCLFQSVKKSHILHNDAFVFQHYDLPNGAFKHTFPNLRILLYSHLKKQVCVSSFSPNYPDLFTFFISQSPANSIRHLFFVPSQLQI